MVYKNICGSIGNTPLIKLSNLEKSEGLKSEIYAKIESFNPAGSVKDRAALYMIEDGIKEGRIGRDTLLIEATSGNTGIALAAIAKAKGLRCVIVMPDSMSEERRKLIAAYGGELVLTPGEKGMAGAIARAEEINAERKDSVIVGQFVNKSNVRAHYETTGPEIWRDTDGNLDIFISAVGTGGTVTGTGRFLKEKDPKIEVVAVEPSASPVLSGGNSGAHRIQGIGAGFIPKILDTSVIDRIVTVDDEEAFYYAKRLSELEGILPGISSGAAVCAAVRLAKEPGKRIVVILPDGGEKYISTRVFERNN